MKKEIPYTEYEFYRTTAKRLGCLNYELLDFFELKSEIRNKSPDILELLEKFVDSQKFKTEISDYNWKIVTGETPDNEFSEDYLDARKKLNDDRIKLINNIEEFRIENGLEQKSID